MCCRMRGSWSHLSSTAEATVVAAVGRSAEGPAAVDGARSGRGRVAHGVLRRGAKACPAARLAEGCPAARPAGHGRLRDAAKGIAAGVDTPECTARRLRARVHAARTWRAHARRRKAQRSAKQRSSVMTRIRMGRSPRTPIETSQNTHKSANNFWQHQEHLLSEDLFCGPADQDLPQMTGVSHISQRKDRTARWVSGSPT